jgi:hypothetical protein
MSPAPSPVAGRTQGRNRFWSENGSGHPSDPAWSDGAMVSWNSRPLASLRTKPRQGELIPASSKVRTRTGIFSPSTSPHSMANSRPCSRATSLSTPGCVVVFWGVGGKVFRLSI